MYMQFNSTFNSNFEEKIFKTILFKKQIVPLILIGKLITDASLILGIPWGNRIERMADRSYRLEIYIYQRRDL